MLWLDRVVPMIEFALSTRIYIQPLRMKWSIMMNKFPHLILFIEIPTYFEITASQTLFIVRSVLNWFFKPIFKLVIGNLRIANFSD